MKSESLTIDYFEPLLDSKYMRPDVAKDEAAQYVMTHFKQHPIYLDYYYDEKNEELFHVTVSHNLCRKVYKINPSLQTCIKGTKTYSGDIIHVYLDGKSTTKVYRHFIKECVEGRIEYK